MRSFEPGWPGGEPKENCPTPRIQLFGVLSIEGCRKPLALRSSKAIAAILCLNPSASWRREDLANLIWPAAEPGEARNRLRTSLAGVRSALEGSLKLSGDREVLRVESTNLEVDLWQARSLAKRRLIAVDLEEEERSLRSLLAIIGSPLLADFPDLAMQERDRWRRAAVEGSLRLGSLMEQRQDTAGALEVYRRALEQAPYDEALWKAKLQASAASGARGAALQEFKEARSRAKRQGFSPFGPDLLRLADAIRTGSGSHAVGAESGVLAQRLVLRLIGDEIDLALKVIGSKSFRAEVFQEPRAALELLDKVLAKAKRGSPERLQCLTFAMMAHTLLTQTDSLIKVGKEIMTWDKDEARLRAAATMMSHAYFSKSQMERAVEMAEVAVQHAVKAGNVPGILIAKGSKASLEWHLQKGGSPEQDLIAAIEGLGPFADHHAVAGKSVLNHTLGVLRFMCGRHREADADFRSAAEFAVQTKHTAVLLELQATQGANTIALGNLAEGAGQLAAGLAERHRSGSETSLAACLGLSALALASMGRRSEAKGLVRWLGDYRKTIKFPPTPYERIYYRRILECCEGAPPRWDWAQEPTVRGQVERILAVLEASSEG